MRHPIVGLLPLGIALAGVMITALVYYERTAATAATPARAALFVGLLASGLVLYVVSVRLILRAPSSASALWIVLGVAALVRLVFLPAPPLLSTDIYRYVWDGQVQAAGINPYVYVPADPALARLRDAEIYPRINRADYARTIYPPMAQIVFAAVGRVTGSVMGMKAAMLAFEGMAILALLQVLRLLGLPRERILIYAWNPLPLWSFACDGHVDALAVGFVGLALLARTRRRDGLAGALLALATLSKFLPIVIAPAFVHGGRVWRPVLAGTAVIAVLYGLYASAGAHVLGFLTAYGSEENYDTGTGFWLLAGLSRIVDLPPYAASGYVTCVGAAYVLLALWIVRGQERRPDATALYRDTAILAGFVTAAFSPHYPWYYAWLALPCVVSPVPAVIWLSAAPVLLHVDPFGDRFAWASLVFVPAIGLAAWSTLHRRFPSHRCVAETT